MQISCSSHYNGWTLHAVASALASPSRERSRSPPKGASTTNLVIPVHPLSWSCRRSDHLNCPNLSFFHGRSCSLEEKITQTAQTYIGPSHRLIRMQWPV